MCHFSQGLTTIRANPAPDMPIVSVLCHLKDGSVNRTKTGISLVALAMTIGLAGCVAPLSVNLGSSESADVSGIQGTPAQRESARNGVAAISELTALERNGDVTEATLTTEGFAAAQAAGGNAPKTVVDNGDGTVTVTMTRTRTSADGAQIVETVSRIVDKATKKTRRVDQRRTSTLKDGTTRVQTRVKTFNADGSFTVVARCVRTRPDGKTRIVDETKTRNADGSWTASGTVKQFDGTTMTFTRVKAATVGKTHINETDPANNLQIDADYDDGSPVGIVIVTVNGKPAGNITVPDDN
jgi:hypothetical protein